MADCNDTVECRNFYNFIFNEDSTCNETIYLIRIIKFVVPKTLIAFTKTIFDET